MTNYDIKKIEWNELVELSKKISNDLKDENIKIDTLVPILRGGMVLSLLLTNYLDNVDTASIHIKRSKSNLPNSEFGEAMFKGITNENAIHNKNILLVEDIIDKGYSLDLAIDKIKKYNPKKIYIATFYNFNNNKYKNVFSGKKYNDIVWILFPWEVDINGN